LARDVTSENAVVKAGSLIKAWNGQELMKDVQAQTAITQAFSAQAPKAVAEFADERVKRLLGDAAKASPDERKDLLAEAGRWQEGGSYRAVLHTINGGLSGGLGGAAGAATVSASTNLLTEFQARVSVALERQGMGAEAATVAAQGIAQLTSLGIGAAVGNSAGAAAALPADTNNRMLHAQEQLQISRLANFSNGRFTQEQVREALRYSGLKDANGRVILAEGARETYLSTDSKLNNVQTGQSYADTLATDPTPRRLHIFTLTQIGRRKTTSRRSTQN
jgi:hypothetical protein